MRTRIVVILLLLVLVAACSPNTASPTATSDALLVDGFLPKVIVTIDMTATAERQAATAITPTSDDDSTQEATRQAARLATPTASPTHYVGVFIGEPTSVGPEGEIEIPPTIPPLTSNTNAGGAVPGNIVVQGASAGSCSVSIADAFAAAYETNPALQAFGCPVDGGISTLLVTQRFERGRMFWRDTSQILILSDDGTFWRTTDTWHEGLPADDPSLVPPEGASQPIRGFGLAWRSSDTFRNALGWALGPEVPLSSFWQEFSGGSLFLGENGTVYALPSSDSGQYVGGVAR